MCVGVCLCVCLREQGIRVRSLNGAVNGLLNVPQEAKPE